MVDAGTPGATGFTTFVEGRYRRLPRLDLFGETASLLERTDFGLRLLSADVVAQWQPRPGFGLSGRAGVMTLALFPGTNEERANTDDRFAIPLGLSRVADTRYSVAGIGATLDTRNERRKPTRGFLLVASAWAFAPATSALSAFERFIVEGRAYRATSPRHVLAARLLASADHSQDQGEVPFFLLPTLGGTTTLRSFPSYRFRGDRLMTATIESRWDVHELVELAPFIDLGHVSGPPLAHDAKGLLTSVGVSTSARWRTRVLARMDVAAGREGLRVSIGFDSTF